MQNHFVEPTFEIIRFNACIVASSPDCGCWDGDFQWIRDCTGDGKACVCSVNHVTGTSNCTPL